MKSGVTKRRTVSSAGAAYAAGPSTDRAAVRMPPTAAFRAQDAERRSLFRRTFGGHGRTVARCDQNVSSGSPESSTR